MKCVFVYLFICVCVCVLISWRPPILSESLAKKKKARLYSPQNPPLYQWVVQHNEATCGSKGGLSFSCVDAAARIYKQRRTSTSERQNNENIPTVSCHLIVNYGLE